MTDRKPLHVERRQHADRRADSPKLREWVNGLSRLGKIAVALVGALGGAAAARGLTVSTPTDLAALTARVTVLETHSEQNAAILGGLARQSCMSATEQQVVYSQMPCDSLMRGVGGWRAIRAETLPTKARP